MNRQEREAFERAVIEHLDGAADSPSAEALRATIAASPEHRALFTHYEGLWASLGDLAAIEQNAARSVDLKDAVLAAIASGRLPEDSPEIETPSRASIAAEARELLIDPMDEAARAAADDLRAVSGVHREEMDAYAALAGELEHWEREQSPSFPEVDLRDGVFATLDGHGADPERTHATPGREVVSFRRGRMHRTQPVQWPLIAAAAVLLMMIGGWSLFVPRDAEAPVDTVAVAPAPAPAEPDSVIADPESDPVPPEKSPLESAFHRMAEAMPQPLPATPAPEATIIADLQAITLEDIWSAQQAALATPDGRAAVRALAKLPADHAQALAERPGQRPEVVAGLARSLPPAEARAALLAVRDDREPTPSLVFAQAEATWTAGWKSPDEPAPEDAPDLAAIIAELRALDPENALTYYWEAVNRLQEGDLEGALALLQAAEALESAQAYSLDDARATQAALEAAGMSRDAAVAAAALSAGMSQYEFLTALGQDLLDEAFRYEALGYTDAAEQILNAAQRFGAQIEAGGDMSWEQLAGLDLQRAAIEALEAFFLAPEDLMTLTNDALNLVVGMESMASFFEAMNSFFLQPFDADFFAEFSNMLLLQGDLELFGAEALAPPQNKWR